MAIEKDLEDFRKVQNDPRTLDEFLNGFVEEFKSEGVETHNDVYSMLLNVAICLKDEKVVRTILKDDHGDILTSVDQLKYSPLAHMFHSGDRVIRSLVKSYINRFLRDHEKAEPNHEADAYILTSMMYPKFKDMTRRRYLDILEALYTDVKTFTELLDTFDED